MTNLSQLNTNRIWLYNLIVFFALSQRKESIMVKKKKRRHLTIEDRMIIQACLHDMRTFAQIASRLEVYKSTISREINNHKTTTMKSFPRCERRDKLNGICMPVPIKHVKRIASITTFRMPTLNQRC